VAGFSRTLRARLKDFTRSAERLHAVRLKADTTYRSNPATQPGERPRAGRPSRVRASDTHRDDVAGRRPARDWPSRPDKRRAGDSTAARLVETSAATSATRRNRPESAAARRGDRLRSSEHPSADTGGCPIGVSTACRRAARNVNSSGPWCKSIVAPRTARRPDGKARRLRISGIFEGGATQPAGMHRRSNADGVAPRAARARG